MKRAVVSLLFLMVVICLVMPAFGAGMEIPGVGAKAKGMGGAFRAIADDWSAAYYNPAGLFYVTENQITFNEVVSNYQFKYTPSVLYGDYGVGFYDGKLVHNRYEILSNPTLGGYFRLPFSGKSVTLGFTIFQPFDQNVSWQVFQPLNNQFLLPGQQIEHNFDAVAFNVVAAVELMENRLALGVSAGVLKADLVYGGFFLRPNPIDSSAPYFQDIGGRPNELITEWQHADGNGFAPNFRVGLLFKATPKLNIGVSAAPKVNVTVDGETYYYFYMPDIPSYHGRSDVTANPNSIDYILSSGVRYDPTGSFETEINLPTQVGGGIAYEVNEKLRVAGDLEYTMWSDFEGYVFDNEFEDSSITTNAMLNQWMTQDMALPVDTKNTLRGSIGLEYKYSDAVRLRGGYTADQSPYEETTLHPAFFDSGLKHSVNLGLGLVFENIILDYSFQYTKYPESQEGGNTFIDGDNVVDNLPGIYNGYAVESIFQFTVRF